MSAASLPSHSARGDTVGLSGRPWPMSEVRPIENDPALVAERDVRAAALDKISDADKLSAAA